MFPIRDTIPSKNTPFGTWILIAANVVVFIFELMLPEPCAHFCDFAEMTRSDAGHAVHDRMRG